MTTERTQLLTPAVASATAVHAAIALTSVAQTVTAAITQPDCYRALSVKGNQAGIAGNVEILGTAWNGAAITDTIALAGASVVAGVLPLKTVTSITLPALTGAGDTVSVGIADKFGFYNSLALSADVLLQERAASGATEFTIESAGTVSATYDTVAATIVAGDRIRWTYLDSLPVPSGFVSLEEFAERYETTIPTADEALITTLLGDASALVSQITGIDYETVAVPAVTVAIICAAVRRAYANPTGLQSETIGDYTWRGGPASSGVYLTADEKRTVRRAAGKLGVGTIGLQGDLPLGPLDSRYYQYMSDAGVLIVNAAEPEDL